MLESNTQSNLDDILDDLFAQLGVTTLRRAQQQALQKALKENPLPENLPADFLPKDQTQGGGYVEAQPHWSR